MVSEEIWQKRLQRFCVIANPARDVLGLPVRRCKMPEHVAAMEYYRSADRQSANFMFEMVTKLYHVESAHAGHKAGFGKVKRIFDSISPATFAQHKAPICAVLVRLDRELEQEWYVTHPSKAGPSFRWSFRHLMMQRCHSAEAREIEHCMQYHELAMPLHVGATHLDTLRAYSRQR